MLQRSIICINSIIVRGNGNKNVEQTIFFMIVFYIISSIQHTKIFEFSMKLRNLENLIIEYTM